MRLNSPEFRNRFSVIDEWLRLRGFDKNDRFRRYRRDIEEMSERSQSYSPEELYADLSMRGRVAEFLTSFVEGMEFVRCLHTLIEKSTFIPDELLKRVLEGHWNAAEENARSSLGRNAMFELHLAAAIANQNLSPILRTENPDVEFVFQSRRVLIECKRVFSENRILENISHAFHQLERCGSDETADAKVAAISVSRLAHQGDAYWNADSHEAGEHFLQSELWRLIADHENRLIDLRRFSAVGIIFYVSAPFYISHRGFTTLGAGLFFPIKVSHKAFLQDLAGVLRL